MQRGFWNIPVPLERQCVIPDALLIPLVGYDAAGYRLGYGGGYYDRTLAALTPRPFCIGVAYDDVAARDDPPAAARHSDERHRHGTARALPGYVGLKSVQRLALQRLLPSATSVRSGRTSMVP